MENLIKEEIEKIHRKYSESAEEIVGGYNRERSLSQDYRGRQIYELLQNADDETDKEKGKVLISFNDNILSVSNNGNPFSFAGIKSLLYPNASPKGVRANKIGCKGLGFRSILNWSDSIKVIIGEDFGLHFSKENADRFLDSIYAENPAIKEAIEKITHDDHPIAILTCPELLNNESPESGYTTSIVMECHDDVSEDICKQLKSLELEELIFLPNLKEVEIICGDYHKNFFKIVEKDTVMIEAKNKLSDNSITRTWNLYRKTGTISVDDNAEKEYEFIIAYDKSGKSSGKYLYSYFRTDVSLCFPALIHGTFELTSDRNNLLKNSKVNELLINKLAEFMVETAVKISEEKEVCDYCPLSLVISTKIDSILNDEYKLDSLLREKIKTKKIFPSISGRYISIDNQPKYSDRRFADILNPDVFSELLKVTENESIRLFLKNYLKLPFYDYTDFCKRLNGDINYYNMESKAKLVSFINAEFPGTDRTDRSIFPHLMADSNGNNISDTSKVYPEPTEGNIIALPEWINIKFINEEMWKLLQSELKAESIRNLVPKLSRYNVEEYNFTRLLNGVLDNDISDADKCSDVLKWLWKNYNPENPQSIDNKNIKVICRDGSIQRAAECYIGKEYGNDTGEKLTSIYSQNFVAEKEILNIDCEDVNKLAGFLEWLGASKYPRKISRDFQKENISGFLDTCYPLYVENDKYFYQEEEIREITNIKLGFFEHLDEILDKADFNDIIAWCLKDDKIKKMIDSETEEINPESEIKFFPVRKQQREVTGSHIKSYLRYYLKNRKWIKDKHGNKADPLHCCFEENSLKPIVIVPDIKYGYLKNQVGATKKEIDVLLNKTGVSDSFQELDKRVIYEVLFKLPVLDPECKKAKSLYRKIIRNGLTPEEYQKDNPEYKKFLRSGKVAVSYKGKNKYVPVEEARYADKKIFSKELLRTFNMLNVDARAGEEKVKKIFGVSPLKEVDGNVEGQPVHSSLEEKFREEYRRFIPFIYACRYNIKDVNKDAKDLMNTIVSLCNEVNIRYEIRKKTQLSTPGKYEIRKETKLLTLEEYEMVYFRNLKTAYICIPEKFADINELKHDYDFADLFAELISAIIDVKEDRDFFRDLFRENDLIREKKMIDKGDDNLEKLNYAREKLNISVDIKTEFWLNIAKLKKISENVSTPEDVISLLELPSDIDNNLDYSNLSSTENIEPLKRIFKALKLNLNLASYNEFTYHQIDVKKYWVEKIKSKMQLYRNKYLAYCFEKLKEHDRCIELYEQRKEEFDYFDPVMENSLSVDIDEFFKKEFDVDFAELDKYDDNTVSEKIKEEKSRISQNDLVKLEQYDNDRRDVHILFGKTNELTEPTDNEQPPSLTNKAMEINPKAEMDMILASIPEINTRYVSTRAGKAETKKTGSNGKKQIYSEPSDRKKQEMGMLGEYMVYKQLKNKYSDVNWVSGNAEKTGIVNNGDDACGYDIRYKDENNNIHYVEVKSSNNKDIAFFITNNELRFGCNHLKTYEIIYVVFGTNGKPTGEILNLSNPFDLSDGEELYRNSKFLIQNDTYHIKMIRDNAQE